MKLEGIKDCLTVHNADISGSTFDDVNMSGSAVDNVNLAGCTFHNVNMSGRHLRRRQSVGLEGA